MIAGVKYEVIKDGKKSKPTRHKTKQKALDSASKTLNRKGGTVMLKNISFLTKKELAAKKKTKRKAAKARKTRKKISRNYKHYPKTYE